MRFPMRLTPKITGKTGKNKAINLKTFRSERREKIEVYVTVAAASCVASSASFGSFQNGSSCVSAPFVGPFSEPKKRTSAWDGRNRIFLPFLCFGIHAWIRYLALDGVRPFTMLSRKKDGNMSIEQISFRFSALLGFERNQVEAVDDRNLDDDEVAVAKLSSSVLAACFFLIPSVIANVR